MAKKTKAVAVKTNSPSTEPGVHIIDVRRKLEFFCGRSKLADKDNQTIGCEHNFPFNNRKAMCTWLGFPGSDRLKKSQGGGQDSYSLSHAVINALATTEGCWSAVL